MFKRYRQQRIRTVCAFLNAKSGDIRLGVSDNGKVVRIDVRQSKDRSWQNMSDMDILKTSSLRQRDLQTGQEGLTLAGILLFGKDVLISAAVPVISDNDLFKFELKINFFSKLAPQDTMHVGMQVVPQDILREVDKEKAILSFCAIAKTRNEIQNMLELKTESALDAIF
ncbi:MAG: ATP-binding protein [Endomicrobium sp.]|jgi:predicted HTH transcriptional regulator|nr:ATP-binding protein [Endomicrobium sp.]